MNYCYSLCLILGPPVTFIAISHSYKKILKLWLNVLVLWLFHIMTGIISTFFSYFWLYFIIDICYNFDFLSYIFCFLSHNFSIFNFIIRLFNIVLMIHQSIIFLMWQKLASIHVYINYINNKNKKWTKKREWFLGKSAHGYLPNV